MSNTTTIRIGVLALGAALILGGQAFASDRGSPEDQLACTPDVYRLCSSDVPNEDAIVACLTRNIRALTAACHNVMTRPANPSDGANNDD